MEMTTRKHPVKERLHEKVAARIVEMIEQGVYRPGDRLPSIRGLSRRMSVSINTTVEAYADLENMGVVEARPQSGYYVRPRLAEPAGSRPKSGEDEEPVACCVSLEDGPLRVMRTLADPSLVPLGGGIPNPDLLPIDRLNRMLASESRRFRVQSVSYAGARGVKRLRGQLARRMLDAECAVSPDDIVVTSGCVEAVTLALHATCRPGDTVAVGSPVYYTFLYSIQWLGLKVLEIPSSPRDGINIDVLEYALKSNPVRACLLIPNFNNPLGYLMPEGKKREIVSLLGSRDIPLIEDDVYGDLAFGPARPPAVKAYDEKGLVLYCSSFSKTLAPGYRVGWIVPGRYGQRIRQLKSLFNIATATPTQLAMAEFLMNGGYDHHLRKIRRVYSRHVGRMRDAVGRFFPVGTAVSRPEGGFFLWVEMPDGVDASDLHERAQKEGISIAPGTVFSTSGEGYRNCLRLNTAFWSERIEQALETVGGLACAAG